jgi:hypothetical protein
MVRFNIYFSTFIEKYKKLCTEFSEIECKYKINVGEYIMKKSSQIGMYFWSKIIFKYLFLYVQILAKYEN